MDAVAYISSSAHKFIRLCFYAQQCSESRSLAQTNPIEATVLLSFVLGLL